MFTKHVKGLIKNCIGELRGTVPKPNSANSRHLFGNMSFYNNAADKFRLSEHWSENISMQVTLVSQWSSMASRTEGSSVVSREPQLCGAAVRNI